MDVQKDLDMYVPIAFIRAWCVYNLGFSELVTWFVINEIIKRPSSCTRNLALRRCRQTWFNLYHSKHQYTSWGEYSVVTEVHIHTGIMYVCVCVCVCACVRACVRACVCVCALPLLLSGLLDLWLSSSTRKSIINWFYLTMYLCVNIPSVDGKLTYTALFFFLCHMHSTITEIIRNRHTPKTM